VTDQQGTAAEVVALPVSGEILPDARGGGRWMRVTWHDAADLVVLSLWRDDACVATFRLTPDQVPALVNDLVTGLAARGQRPGSSGSPAGAVDAG
jgi:hypothetical protein